MKKLIKLIALECKTFNTTSTAENPCGFKVKLLIIISTDLNEKYWEMTTNVD